MGAGADKDAHGKGRCSCWRNCNRNRPGEGRDNAVLSLLVRGRRSESVHAGPLGKAIPPLPVSFAPTISRCSKTSRLSLGRFFFFFSCPRIQPLPAYLSPTSICPEASTTSLFLLSDNCSPKGWGRLSSLCSGLPWPPQDGHAQGFQGYSLFYTLIAMADDIY